MPTFNGVDIFGAAPEFRSVKNPGRWQFNAYPGVHGREGIFHGTDGGVTEVFGLLTAANVSALQTLEAGWRAYQAAGRTYTLVDNLGTSWPNVLLMEFEPLEEVKPYLAGVSRRYRAVFVHLN